MRLWDRDYELYLGWGTGKDRKGILVKDLNIEFKCHKVINNRLHPSKSVISIYNLNEDQSSELQKSEVTVRLVAGYKGQLNGLLEVCLGNTVKVQTIKKGPDRITELHIGEAYSILHNTRIVKESSPGTTVEDIIRSVAKDANLTVGSMDGQGIQKRVYFGYPLSGTVKEILDEISATYWLDYSISGTTISVRDTGGILDKKKTIAFVYNEDTGMLDIPYYEKWDEGHTKADRVHLSGMKMRVLMNPSIIPGSVIKLDRQDADNDEVKNGLYVVREVEYEGEYRGNNWHMILKCEPGREIT